MTESDDLWRVDRRERWDEVGLRVRRFLAWLVLPQHYATDNVVVVSHGVWIEALLRSHAPDALGHDQRVYNTDAFACECVSTNGAFVRIQNVRQICGNTR